MLVSGIYWGVMKSTYKLGAMALAAMLVLSVVAPTALAAAAAGSSAGNTAGNVAVDTGDATNVTNSSAEVHGEVTGLADNESATVYFTYWVQGDEANATDTANASTDEDTEFKETITGLQNNTTYVYVAKADVNNTTVSGEQKTFTTGAEEDDNASDAFGQEVSAFVHSLLDDDDREGGIGQAVSEFVTANNPGADKRPDHAGPPEDRGPKDKADKQNGPPEHAGGPDADTTSDDEEENDDGDDDEADAEDDHPGNEKAKGKQ